MQWIQDLDKYNVYFLLWAEKCKINEEEKEGRQV